MASGRRCTTWGDGHPCGRGRGALTRKLKEGRDETAVSPLLQFSTSPDSRRGETATYSGPAINAHSRNGVIPRALHRTLVAFRVLAPEGSVAGVRDTAGFVEAEGTDPLVAEAPSG